MEFLELKQQSRNIVNFPNKIHPSAIVADSAQIGPNVSIGPYSIIGEHVKIGANTVIGSHVVIEGWTTIGERNQIGIGAIIGNTPQDLKFRGEESYVLIGNDNIIREYVTINRGTEDGGGTTCIGNQNLLMTSVHVAHDVKIGSHTVLANAVALAGHVIIDDWATVGGFVGVHQFTRIGCLSMVGCQSRITKDIPPYMLVNGNPAKLCCLNMEGLRRQKFSPETKSLLQRTYHILFRAQLTLEDAIEKIELELPSSVEVNHLAEFLKQSNRGFYR